MWAYRCVPLVTPAGPLPLGAFMFTTEDLDLAAYLRLNGHAMKFEWHRRRCVFVFTEVPDLLIRVAMFTADEAEVKAKAFALELRLVKDEMFEARKVAG